MLLLSTAILIMFILHDCLYIPIGCAMDGYNFTPQVTTSWIVVVVVFIGEVLGVMSLMLLLLLSSVIFFAILYYIQDPPN
jgi:hypothetical protein